MSIESKNINELNSNLTDYVEIPFTNLTSYDLSNIKVYYRNHIVWICGRINSGSISSLVDILKFSLDYAPIASPFWNSVFYDSISSGVISAKIQIQKRTDAVYLSSTSFSGSYFGFNCFYLTES